MPSAGPPRLRKSLLAACAILAWFNCGSERIRTTPWEEVERHPEIVLAPANLVRAFVSREGDEHLYFEYTRLVLGEPADLEFIARKQHVPVEALAARIRPGATLRLPYRDFPFEYPPLPLVVMLAPRIVAGTLPAYRLAFGLLMAFLTLGTIGIAIRLARRMGADHAPVVARRLAWLVFATGPIVVARFDPLPALLTALALLWWTGGRGFRGGLALGLGAMAKLYPIVLLLPWIAPLVFRGRAGIRDALRLIAGAALGACAAALPFLLLCPRELAQSVLLYGARPFQVESLVGGVALLLGGGVGTFGGFGSDNVAVAEWLGRGFSLVFPLALVGVSVLAARAERRGGGAGPSEQVARVCAATAAALLALLCGSKVLSPQFLLWLVPGVVLLPGRSGRRLALLAIAGGFLTQTYYPYLYEDLTKGRIAAVLLLMARNAVLLLATATALRAVGGSARPSTTGLRPAARPERGEA